jgi:hypothetical protein
MWRNQVQKRSTLKCNTLLTQCTWVSLVSCVINPHTRVLYLCPPPSLVFNFSAISILSIIQPNAINFSSNSIACDFSLELQPNPNIHLKFDQMRFFSWNSTKSKISVGIQPNAVLSSEIQPKSKIFSLNLTEWWYYSWSDGIHVEPIFVSH